MDGASCERRYATDLPPAWARTGKRTFKNKSSWDWHNEKFIAHYSWRQQGNFAQVRRRVETKGGIFGRFHAFAAVNCCRTPRYGDRHQRHGYGPRSSDEN